MNIINNLAKELKGVTGISNEYLLLIVISIITVIVIKFINKVVNKIFGQGNHSSREVFKFAQRCNMFSNLLIILVIFIIWEGHLDNVVTIISFISAGATIALREVILNLIAGVYIRFNRPFVVEDRIEIDGIKGDVVLISAMNFKVLEIGNRVNGEQSTGIIVNIPNSKIFSGNLKNYTTAFKYIWSEMVIKVDASSDIDKTKKKLYEIVNKNEIIKSIPKKMDKAIDEASSNYRIYYNNLKPIIYTEYNEGKIEFTIRFLVHPKKERNVIDALWINIIKESQNVNIMLAQEQ